MSESCCLDALSLPLLSRKMEAGFSSFIPTVTKPTKQCDACKAWPVSSQSCSHLQDENGNVQACRQCENRDLVCTSDRTQTGGADKRLSGNVLRRTATARDGDAILHVVWLRGPRKEMHTHILTYELGALQAPVSAVSSPSARRILVAAWLT